MAAETQAAALQRKLPPAKPKAAGKLKVLIPSALSRQITPDQEDQFLQHALSRRRTLEDELGRYDFTQVNWINQAAMFIRHNRAMPFFAKRHLAHLVYHMEMDWRGDMLGGIWKESNIHLPLTRRTVQQQIARAAAYFFGTSPWFSASPKPTSDTWNADFADKCDRWAKHEADQSNLDGTLTETIKLAFIQGEQVTKTIHDRHVSYYRKEAMIACDPKGNPFVAKDGDYIFENDRFIPYVPPAADDGAVVAQPAMFQPGTMVLQRDNMTPRPDFDLHFEKRLIDRKIVHFDGARTINIRYMDFLCPLTAPDIQRAGDEYHLYSEQVISLVNRLMQNEWANQVLSPKEQLAAISELTSQFIGGTGDDKQASAEQPRPEQREAEQMMGRDRNEPEISIAESYHHYDIDHDGVLESLVLIQDKDGRVPIYYDYVANVTHDGTRPFTVHRVNAVEGRWHGQGQCETLNPLQIAADLQLNRWNFAQTSAARVDFFAPQLTIEGEKDPRLKVNWGRSYRKKDPKTPAGEILESVYLREIKGQDLQQLMELMIQMMTNMSGIANANDSRMAGLDTAELATGVNNIEQSGQELFGLWIKELSPSIKDALSRHIGVTLSVMDAPRIFRFFDYDEGSQKMVQRLGHFDPADARDLSLDFILELTRYRGQTENAQGEAGWKVATEYYAQPAPVQQRLADLARQRLRANQVRNPDRIIVPVTPEEVAVQQATEQAGVSPAQ